MNTKAVRIHGKMDLRLDEITLPEVGPDDVQVRVLCDSACMSTYKAADRKSTRLNSSHLRASRMPSSA